MQALNAYQRNTEEAPAYWQVDILWLILASGADTNQTFSLMEELCPQNAGPPPHTHAQFEAFYIIDGTITFLVDGAKLVGRSGSIITVPPGVVHSFRVDSKTARVLNLYVPAGFERSLVELGQPAVTRTLPPPGLPIADSPQEIKALFSEIGMVPVNEPDVLRQRTDSRMDLNEQTGW